jgi:hypothetical protein
LIIALTAFSSLTNAQKQAPEGLPNPFQVVKKYVEQNNYITPIIELKAQEEKYVASPQWKSTYLEMMILLQTYVSDYEESYRYENILLESTPSYKRIREMYAKDITVSPVADYRMLDALDAIESVADQHQVIMINEEHRTSFHRASTLQLLRRLYAKGFRYFAAETIYAEDADLQKRAFPTQNSGFYTADPVYADVIRAALKLGYKIVPYESMDADCRSPENNPEFCNDQRERGQAQNLYDRILKTDPQARIFVHVGRGHNSKAAGSKEFNFMGYYFKQITGIEPFTIDQLRFSERRISALEHPLYRYLTKQNTLQKPSVFQSPGSEFYNLGLGYDMVIFHPRLSYKNGRATFLEMNGERKAEKINLKKLKLKSKNQIYSENKPVLIQAFYAQESTDAVPIDQIVIYPNQKIPVLMLPVGSFRIRAIDETGKILRQYEKKLNS